MALISCPDCNLDVSDQAPACPNCGRPIKPTPAREKPREGLFLSTLNAGCATILIFILVVVCAIIYGISSHETKNSPSGTAANPTSFPREVLLVGTAQAFRVPSDARENHLGFVDGGQSVTAVAKSGKFYRIRLQNGTECWVQEGFLKPYRK